MERKGIEKKSRRDLSSLIKAGNLAGECCKISPHFTFLTFVDESSIGIYFVGKTML